MPEERIRVLLADDQALLRGSLRVLIESERDLVVVGEADSGRQAIDMVRVVTPDVVLMDIRMPGIDGIEATSIITRSAKAPRIIVLTTFDLDEYVYAALRAGASGFLLKDVRPAQLLEALRVVASGEALLAPSVTRRLIAEFARGTRPVRPAVKTLERVTDREREVLTLIARGLSNTEIEHDLHLSRGTVKTHIGRLLAKLGARDRAQLVIIGYETGLVVANVSK